MIVPEKKPRKLAKAAKISLKREEHLGIVQDIQELETRAHRLGLYVTAHALNQAKNALGWELVGDIRRAGQASRGERPPR